MLVGVMSGGSGGMWLLLMRPIITAVTQNLFCVVFFVLLGLGGLLTAHIHIGSSTLLRTNVKKRNKTITSTVTHSLFCVVGGSTCSLEKYKCDQS